LIEEGEENMTARTIIHTAWIAIFAISVVLLVGCAGSPDPSILAGSTMGVQPEMERQILWVGTGTSSIWRDGVWVRTPASDYEFLVRQNRFPDHWESLKVQNRTDPDYDGSAGPADQQHFFLIEYGRPNAEGNLPITLRSTYGDGTGLSDTEYRKAVIEFEAEGVSRFAPYNRFRITQHYLYEEGLLEETVELFKLKDDGTETPFVKVEERARIFYR
jgi:hypothetical protein